jgi:CxxC-x17-CxxC domain-containing protein
MAAAHISQKPVCPPISRATQPLASTLAEYGGHAMSGGDVLLTCSDCGQEFVFTAGEQQFYQERGYSSPRRCKPCRQAKQGSASHGRQESSGGGFSTGTTVVCASCGQTTTVPFEPRGDRPVYCKDCYRPKQGGGGGGGRQGRGGGGGRDRRY